MVFNYKWSDKENGNFAIKKRNSKGIRIEKVRNQQTSDSYYFILVDVNDKESMYNALRGLNIILDTITFDYRQKETDKKSGTPFLKKESIENVLNNIEQYKNKTITIETASSKAIQQIKNRYYKNWKEIYEDSFGNNQYKSIIDMLISNNIKKQELKNKQLETKKQIKKLQNDLLKTETTINADIEKFEKAVFTILKSKLKDLQYTGGESYNNFQNLLDVLYPLAKKEIRNEKASIRQKRYRKKKNERSEKPKRKRGRPRKIIK
jgi:hypothetical protein